MPVKYINPHSYIDTATQAETWKKHKYGSKAVPVWNKQNQFLIFFPFHYLL